MQTMEILHRHSDKHIRHCYIMLALAVQRAKLTWLRFDKVIADNTRDVFLGHSVEYSAIFQNFLSDSTFSDVSSLRMPLLLDVVENLSSSADAFRVKARSLQRQMWWKECRVFTFMHACLVI